MRPPFLPLKGKTKKGAPEKGAQKSDTQGALARRASRTLPGGRAPTAPPALGAWRRCGQPGAACFAFDGHLRANRENGEPMSRFAASSAPSGALYRALTPPRAS